MDIKVLGAGCAKCEKLFAEVEKAIASTGINARLSKIEKLEDIMAHGVLMTPALIIDGHIKVSGRVAKAAQIENWLRGS
jgi:small redox-active disulfide protein 2